MTLKELKESILSNRLNNDFIIFKYKDNNFLSHQYIDEICTRKFLQKFFIESLASSQPTALSLVLDTSSNLNIVECEEFGELYDDYEQFSNCIVVCEKISKEIQSKVSSYVIEFPKLEEWQVKDFIKTTCKGFDESCTNWFYTVTRGDMYRLTNELDKVKIFDKNEQLLVASQLKDFKTSDLYYIDILSLSNAIVDKNKLVVSDFLRHKYCCDVDPFYLTTLLLNSFKKTLFIHYNSGLTAAEIGASEKQYNFLKNNRSNFSEKTLTNLIMFLSSLDERVKSGALEMRKDTLLDYVICNVFRLY